MIPLTYVMLLVSHQFLDVLPINNLSRSVLHLYTNIQVTCDGWLDGVQENFIGTIYKDW